LSTVRIDRLIARSRRSLWRSEVVVLMLRAVFVWLVVLGVAVILDAVFAFHWYGLVALDVVLIVVGVGMCWPMARRLVGGGDEVRRVALTAEGRLGIADNRLVNAIDLAGADMVGVSSALRDEAVARGEAAAVSFEDGDVVDRGALRGSIRAACVVVVVMLVGYVLVPRVFDAVLPRLVLPWGDYPPYTRLRFEVVVDPGRVYFGKSAEIRVKVSGPDVPGRADVVFLREDGGVESLAMYRKAVSEDDLEEAGAREDRGVGFTFRVERVEESRRFYIDTAGGRSGVRTLTVDMSPMVERVGVVYEYPDYTGWSDVRGALDGGEVGALVGTGVMLEVVSNVPLLGGELRLFTDESGDESAGEVVSFEVDDVDPRVARVGFVLERSGRFEVSLVGGDGVVGDDVVEGLVRGLADRLPRIDIVEPVGVVVVPEGWGVGVEVGVVDDIGVSRVVLHRGLNDEPTFGVELRPVYAGGDGAVGYAGYEIDLGEMGASAGDVVYYYGVVEDNHPGSPQAVETGVHAIHVVTMQRYMDLARSQYRVGDMVREFEGYQEELEGLGAKRKEILGRVEALEAQLGGGDAMSDGRREEVSALEAALEAVLEEYAARSRGLGDAMNERAGLRSLYGVEDSYKRWLSEAGSGLAGQAEGADALGLAVGEFRRGGLVGWRAVVGGEAERFEMLEEPFDEGLAERAREVERGMGLALMQAQEEGGAGESKGDAPVSLVGPAVPGGGGAAGGESRSGGRGGDGRVNGGGGSGEVGGGVESIGVDAAAWSGAGVVWPTGVPMEYREQAAAYFRRIAEESR
jgi:hypothetical protein